MKKQKRARLLLEERLFDLRTRVADLAGRDPDLLFYGILRYCRPKERFQLLQRILGLKAALREL